VFRIVNGYIIKVKANLMETVYFLGVDVSKKSLDAALTIDGKSFHEVHVTNLNKSIESFFRDLKRQFPFSNLIVCLEHTGIYCQPLLDFLVKNKIRVCIEPARQIKLSQGITRGKSDQLDAKRIAQYAYKNRESLIFWKPQRPCIQKLKALLVARERMINVKVQLEVPLNECSEFIEASIRKDMIKYCQKPIEAIQQGIKKIELAIDQLIEDDAKLTDQCSLVTSVPGVGKITALNVIVSTNEFTKISEAKKLACYAGVAPFEHRSGSSIRGKTRVSKMANMTLKRLFHLAAMSAIQCCDELKAFYQRKVAAGKNKMSVINAVRNKLISRIYACINNQRRYSKNI
jgi:transposase